MSSAPIKLGDTDGPPDRASVALNATWLSAATIGARVCSFALAVILGRRLGVAEYGRYGFAAALGTVIAPLADAGLTTYVYREVARDRALGRLQANRLMAAKRLLSILALMVTAGAALALGSSARASAVIIVVVAALLADGVSAFVYGYFQGLEQMTFQARVTVAAAFARSLGGIVSALVFRSLLPVVIWMLVVSALQLAFTWRGFRAAIGPVRRLPGPVPPIHWRAVLTMGLLTLFSLMSIRADSLMIGVIKDHRAVGIYTAAYTILGAIEIIPWQISQAIIPVFARTYEDDRPQFTASWHGGVRIVLLFSLPAALVTSILAHGLLRLPYGSSFDAGAPALAILVWFAPISVFNAIVAGALYGARRELWPTVASGVGVAVNLLANLWAIPTFGIAGAAAVTVATEIAVLVVQIWFMLGSAITPLPQLPYARILLALLALAGLAVALRPLPVFLSASVALLGYAAVLIATGVVDRRELRAIGSLLIFRPAR